MRWGRDSNNSNRVCSSGLRAETRAHFHAHRTQKLSNQGSSLFVLPRVVRV